MMRVDNGLANSFISLRIPFKDSFKDYVPFKISTVVNKPFNPSNHRPNEGGGGCFSDYFRPPPLTPPPPFPFSNYLKPEL